MIWERLIKWKDETIHLLNKELMDDAFMIDLITVTNRTWKNEFIRRHMLM